MHTSGGFLTQTSYTHFNIFDLKPETDVYWCTADIGWVTGHTYIVYGPLSNGATQVVYEGTPTSPNEHRAETCGGTRRSTRPIPPTLLNLSIPSIRCSSCTPPEPPASPKASCTPRAAS
ncbi:Acetyl-CoA synthetase [Mycobacteroides abscessus subsp. abscessus]|nr:Acetyl-CoA synthetase [Mycobacteroides abscessus subsp. abscessus]